MIDDGTSTGVMDFFIIIIFRRSGQLAGSRYVGGEDPFEISTNVRWSGFWRRRKILKPRTSRVSGISLKKRTASGLHKKGKKISSCPGGERLVVTLYRIYELAYGTKKKRNIP